MSNAEVETLTGEISRLRETLARTESTRSTNQREVIACQLEVDKLRAKVAELETGLQRANEAVSLERENARNANLMCQESREKEQAANQEAQVCISFCESTGSASNYRSTEYQLSS